MEKMAAPSSSAKHHFVKVKGEAAGLRTVTHCISLLTSLSEGLQNHDTSQTTSGWAVSSPSAVRARG